MKLYADHPVRALFQLISDALAVLWVYLWVNAALELREIINRLDRPGELMRSTGQGFSEHMDKAAEQAAKVPLAGESLAVPFTNMSETGESLTAAGDSFRETVASLATTLPLLVAAVPVLLVATTWLPARARWIARASAVRRSGGMSPEARARLLALRALTTAPPARLAAIHEDPAGAWRSGDAETLNRLAALELRRMGLKAR
ncbi:hypothetical protein PWG71_07880 [Nocardiopsis sp. N85]|uniref:hypothetical protein n=1 Tax=Nocardiopsis sp. N85 TaxID=3029400 RepID=UPI00237FA052|nr:hypothetical protein [Nocardiopsis sp. N85]MDE3721305.1 hypothetical protein [Nocardiopsis sp. N85]